MFLANVDAVDGWLCIKEGAELVTSRHAVRDAFQAQRDERLKATQPPRWSALRKVHLISPHALGPSALVCVSS